MNRETGRLKVSAVLTAPSSITCEVGRFRSLIWDRHVNMFDHKLEPKPSVARRVEVFTGTGRRRRWSSDEKARILEETLAVGAVVSEVARRHGITSQQLFGWRRSARGRAIERSDAPGFAAVMLEAPAEKLRWTERSWKSSSARWSRAFR